MLEITLKKGLVGKPAKQRKIIAALGLHKYGSSVKQASSPTINGMLKKVEHMVTVIECKDGDKKTKIETKTSKKKVQEK